MSTLQEKFKQLRDIWKETWDFEGAAKEISNFAVEVTESGETDLLRGRILGALKSAQEELEERRDSPTHFLHALRGNGANMPTLGDERAKQLIVWFFKVVHAGHIPDSLTEIAMRSVTGNWQNNRGENKSRMLRDFGKYSKLAEIGPDPERSIRNLKTMLVAARVSMLPQGFAEEIAVKCHEAIELAQARAALAPTALLKNSFECCRALVEAKWSERERTADTFLEQNVSNAVHISLLGIEDILTQQEDAIDDASAFRGELDEVRSKFGEVRYPSSTTIMLRLRSEIENLRQSLARGYDFNEYRDWASDLRFRIKASERGRRGVNWMHKEHVKVTLSDLNDLDEELRSKEQNTAALDEELRLLEEEIDRTKSQLEPVSAGLIKRMGQRIKNGSPLALWIDLAARSEGAKWTARLNGMRDSLKLLWQRMEAEEESRHVAFLTECDRLNAEVATSTNLREALGEIMQMGQSLDEFSSRLRNALRQHVDRLFVTFRSRVCDVNTLANLIRQGHDVIEAHHRRIFSHIDFDSLQQRADRAMQWVGLRDFPRQQRAEFSRAVGRLQNEIRTLQFRQEKVFREREQRGQDLMEEFAREIDESVESALATPGNPEFWLQLVDLDRQLRGNWNTLGDERGEALRKRLNLGFEQIKAERTRFAVEAGRVFAEYSEALNDTLFTLEEEPSRESAMAAIDRIKPIRASLRSECRLLRHHRQEIMLLLSNVSSAIDEAFEQSKKVSSQELSRIKLDIERLEQAIRSATDWKSANAVIATHKGLSAKIREADLNIADRRNLRLEMDRIWLSEIADKLGELRSSRSREERVDDVILRLERQGFLMIVNGVPNIA